MKTEGKRRATPNHKKAATAFLLHGKSAKQALLEAGYAPKQAKKGLMATMKESTPLREAFEGELNKWVKLTELLPVPKVREQLIRTRLTMNVVNGSDKGVQSAKLLGQDKEVNMFEPEIRLGMTVAVMPPAEWRDRYLKEDPSDQ